MCAGLRNVRTRVPSTSLICETWSAAPHTVCRCVSNHCAEVQKGTCCMLVMALSEASNDYLRG